MHPAVAGAGGVEVEHLLSDGVGVGSVGDELEAAAAAVVDADGDVVDDVSDVVHGDGAAEGCGVAGFDKLDLDLSEVDEGVAASVAGRAASDVDAVEAVPVPGDGVFEVGNPVASVDDALDVDALADAGGVGDLGLLGEVHEAAVGGGGVEIEDALPEDVGEGTLGGEAEAAGFQIGLGLVDIGDDVGDVVHGEGAGVEALLVVGLNDFDLNLSEVDEGVASAAGDGDGGVEVAASGVLAAEVFAVPVHGSVEVVDEVSDVLDLVEHGDSCKGT